MHRRAFLSCLGFSPIAAVAAIAAPPRAPIDMVYTAVTPGVQYLLAPHDEHVRRLARDGAREVIEQYDRSAPERMARHMSQRG